LYFQVQNIFNIKYQIQHKIGNTIGYMNALETNLSCRTTIESNNIENGGKSGFEKYINELNPGM